MLHTLKTDNLVFFVHVQIDWPKFFRDCARMCDTNAVFDYDCYNRRTPPGLDKLKPFLPAEYVSLLLEF